MTLVRRCRHLGGGTCAHSCMMEQESSCELQVCEGLRSGVCAYVPSRSWLKNAGVVGVFASGHLWKGLPGVLASPDSRRHSRISSRS